MAYIKVKKLNLAKHIIKQDGFGMFASMMGADPDALKDQPDEELVAINTDKIIGISQKMKTGIKDDDRRCCKLYFTHDNFWAIKWDEELEETLKSLLYDL